MSEPSYPNLDSVPASPEPVSYSERPQRHPILIAASWLIILLGIGLLTGTVLVSQFVTERGTEMSQSEFLNLNMTAKMMMSMPWSEEDKLKQLKQLSIGPLDQRYGHAVLLNELLGPEAAIEQLTIVDKALSEFLESNEDDSSKIPSETQVELRRVVGELFEQYAEGNFDTSKLPADDRELMSDKLGFVGELALLPETSTDKVGREEIETEVSGVFTRIVGISTVGLCVLLAALASSVTLYGMWYFRQSKSHFADQTNRGFVYLETFAAWLAWFIALQFMFAFVMAMLSMQHLVLQFSPLMFFVSLLALVWPCLRGVPVSQMLKDIGWELRNPFKEAAVGAFCYLAMIVPLAMGVIATTGLEYQVTRLLPPGEFESRTTVSHPIEQEIASGDPTIWAFMLIATCIAAPVVEETVFRGVLYRYLRDGASKRFTTGTSIAIAAILNAVLFAAIHPQGIIAVPLLSSLAIGFSLVREWRGSLIAPMTMHAIHNGILVCFAISMMS